MNWEPLETDRLRLRGFESCDLHFLFEHFKNDYVCRYLLDEEPFTDIGQAEGLISYFIDENTIDATRWLIVEKETGEKIGTCGYNLWDRMNDRIEIGYDLREHYTGAGFMTEAVGAILRTAFEDKEINRIQAHVVAGNQRSCALLERLGFTKEGTAREWLRFRGRYHDHYISSLLKTEWENSKR